MGCKPSKNYEILTNNTVPSQKLQKESNASMEEEVANTPPKCKDEEKEDDVIENVEVGEGHQSATNDEEGRFIAVNSSSRKEKVHFFSFEGEEVMSDVERPKIEPVEMNRDGSVGEDEDEKKGEEEEGNQQSNNDSVDLKENPSGRK